MNLRSYLPKYFAEDEFVSIDLDTFYKTYSSDSHMTALETIFAEGVRYALETHELHSENEVQRIAVAQALGMGKVFK
jgi:hypothetical protein